MIGVTCASDGRKYIEERINLIVEQLNNFHKCNDNSEVELFNMFLKLKLIHMLPPEYIGRWAYSITVDKPQLQVKIKKTRQKTLLFQKNLLLQKTSSSKKNEYF